jgi:hypothetical protein
MDERRPQNFENRLDQLKEAARQQGRIPETGIRAVDGPLPRNTAEALVAQNYYDLPILKPPVWEWMIPVYFFLGGLSGMSALIAAGAELKGNLALVRVAMWVAGIGAILSPILLTWDLGLRFLYMLRVFKYQSPMSVGSWILLAFGTFAIPGIILTEWTWHIVQQGGATSAVLEPASRSAAVPLWHGCLGLGSGAVVLGGFSRRSTLANFHFCRGG